MGVPGPVEFPRIGLGKLVMDSEPRRGISAPFAINHERQPDQMTAFHVGTLQRTGMWGPSAFPSERQSGSMQNQAQLSVWEPCKGQEWGDLLHSPRRIPVSEHHRSLQRLTQTKVKTLSVYQRERTMIFWLWGWRWHNNFYFDPLERCRKPSGNKSHTEQWERAYTEPGPLASSSATPSPTKTPENQHSSPLPQKTSWKNS